LPTQSVGGGSVPRSPGLTISSVIEKKWTRGCVEYKYRKTAFEKTEIPPSMLGGSSRQVLRQLNTLFQCGVAGPLGDSELLEQFVSGSEEVAEAAFTALVDRHGAMVLGVCRRVLGNRHAAEDAFQATFLVLARKAPAIARREQLASWLHGVARRAAMDARARAARQHAREKRLGIISPVERMDEIQKSELRSVLDEELAGLPERHRAAIVLCELEGLSRREAAGRLGVSEGTLSSRLARAKIRLRDRLTRRGLALSAAALASALAQDADALCVPASLADSTIRGATLVATGSSLTGVASTSVITLTEGVLKAMLLSKLKLAFLGLVTVALVTTGAGVIAQDRPTDEDRLRSVERKLDRLLEAIGGQNRHAQEPTPSPDSRPAARSMPAATPAPAPTAAPSALPAIAAAPAPPVPPVAPATTRAHRATPAQQPALPSTGLPMSPDVAPPPAAEPQPAGFTPSNSLARRVDMLEERLANLEKRLAHFEQRLSRTSDRGPHGEPTAFVPDARLRTEISAQLDIPTGDVLPPTPVTPASPDAPPQPPGDSAPTPLPSAAPPPADGPTEAVPPTAVPARLGEPAESPPPLSPGDTLRQSM
jgi:RNA polymerase sigma factor (sigma-70 family)